MRRGALWTSVLSAAMFVPAAHAASTFDPAAQFSLGANPNGPWSYGWSQEVGAAFVLDTIGFHDSASGIDPVSYTHLTLPTILLV